MRKHFLLFLLCLATNASLTAQETLRENNGEPTLVERLSNGEIKINSAEMNFQLFTSANAEFVGNELDGMNFKLNRVRLEIKGDVGKWLGYHYRQSFNKYSDPYSLDNLSSSLELAYVNLRHGIISISRSASNSLISGDTSITSIPSGYESLASSIIY